MIKYGLKVLIVVFGLGIFTVASAARFDWVLGQSAVVDDGVVSDTTEQSRFDSVFGLILRTLLFHFYKNSMLQMQEYGHHPQDPLVK